MYDYIARRLAELRLAEREAETNLIAIRTVILEFETAQKSAPPSDPKAGQQGAAATEQAGDTATPSAPAP